MSNQKATNEKNLGEKKGSAKGKSTSIKVQKALKGFLGGGGALHPALIPGIGVADTDKRFKIDWWVFGVAGASVAIFIIIGLFAPQQLGEVASAAVHWVSVNTGWFFSALTIAVFIYMMVVGYSSKGRIRLGADDEEPEFSTFSWVSMLFAAGMGIGLLFFGPYEPLNFFLNVPPSFDVAPGSSEAMYAAISQTFLHWGPLAWSYYALVGGAIAYSSFRRGRSPIISAIFDPIFTDRLKGPLGRIIDIFAILVTLFGTAVSLGLGALQIGRGIEIVSGIGPVGNGIIVAIMVLLTIAFIFSAVSGVKRGIRALSNINLLLALALGIFIFIAGPSLFLLDFIPSSIMAFLSNLGSMLTLSGASGADSSTFMETWTTYYWAWWVSWTPFVGMFIAKISRGRTLREFVTVVIVVPSIVCFLWFATLGGTSIWMESEGLGISNVEASQDVLFKVLENLPLTAVTSVVAMIALGIFFVTSADSASIVMGSISESGRPTPSKPVVIIWGASLTLIAITLLLAGGEDSLSALQALVTVSALPFALVLVLMMVAWWKDLSTDPLMIRQQYASVAIEEGVRLGIQSHGDDFVFSANPVNPDHGAGAWLDTEDPSLTEWYETALTEQIDSEIEEEKN